MDNIPNKLKKLDYWNNKKKEIAEHAITDYTALNNLHFRPGSLVWCKMGENVGFEINKERPALILSKEQFNHGTVTIAPLTTRRGTVDKDQHLLATQYIIYKNDIQNLNEDDSKRIADESLLKVEQIRTLSAARIGNKIGYVKKNKFQAIKNRISTLFDLKH